jgi:nicotinamidase-related amidase
MMKPALLVIDVQNAYFKSGSAETQSLDRALETINSAIGLFRGKKLPVICVQQVDEEEGVVPGREGFDVPAGLKILPSDLHTHKLHGNAFTGTPLKDELARLGVDTLVVTGYCAEYCVLSTYRGATEQALRPMILRDALVSGVPENIGFVENVTDIISLGALKAVLD